MLKNQFSLLKAKRFLPFFITMFLGAFNDNLFKNALIILVTYAIAQQQSIDAQMLVNLAAGLFILPFFLLSALAGQLADTVEKTRIIRWVKLAEIGLMMIGAIGFYTHNLYLLMGVLLGMGIHSTFFGPIKYSIMPQHLAKDELIAGNGLVGAGTFLAILLGTLVGGLLILRENGTILISLFAIGIAVSGYIVSRKIPEAKSHSDNRISWNIFKETWQLMRAAQRNEDVFLSIIGISWFWLIGATYLAQFPALASKVFGADETVVTFLLTLFSIGIGIGSLLCNRLLRGKISGTYVPYGALGMAIAALILYFTCRHLPELHGELIGIGEFLGNSAYWPSLFALLLMPIAGGIYIVPLYAILQERTDDEIRARVVAANNVMNALFMVGSALLTIVLLGMGLNVLHILLLIGLVNIPVAFLIRRLVKRQQTKNARMSDVA